MRKLRHLFALAAIAILAAGCAGRSKGTVTIAVDQSTPQAQFAAGQLHDALTANGYDVVLTDGGSKADIVLSTEWDEALPREGFSITTQPETVTVKAHDANGLIYACREIIERMEADDYFPAYYEDAPEMVLRGACVGVQKPYLLPSRAVYEYPYTPENFPWFYDTELWIEYLDMLVENRMNSLYLWNGHPFASLVRL